MKSTDLDFTTCLHKRFVELFSVEQLDGMRVNKGKSGTLLENIMGIVPEGRLRDLEDCEMKSYKEGESIAITMIPSLLEEIYNQVSFLESSLCKKISKILFIRIDKTNADVGEWFYENINLVDLISNAVLFDRIQKEYHTIITEIKRRIDTDEKIGTINGDGLKSVSRAYLQIRTKDNIPYHPMRFNGKVISGKSYAFYFRNLFVREIIETII
jgi:hypothetical protein